MFKAPASHHCDSFRTSQRYRISSSNLPGYEYRGSSNTVRYWDVWADGVKNLTAAVEAFNNRNNVSLPGTAVIVTQPMSELINNDKNDVVPHCYLLMHKEPGIISHPLTYMLLWSFLFVFKSSTGQ